MTSPNVEFFRFDTVDSTNQVAKCLFREKKITRASCVLAREQTAGRGTHGRTWVSPKDAGIYLSVIEPASGLRVETTTDCTVLVGKACAELLCELTAVEVFCKPINDLYVGDCKLGGILTEALFSGGELTALIIGIGINLRRVPRTLDNLSAQATSLEDHMPPGTFGAIDTDRLINRLVGRVRAAIEANGSPAKR